MFESSNVSRDNVSREIGRILCVDAFMCVYCCDGIYDAVVISACLLSSERPLLAGGCGD